MFARVTKMEEKIVEILTTIKEFMLFLKVERGASAATISTYGGDLNLFSRFIKRQGLTELNELTTPLLRQYFLEGQQAYNYKVNTICRKINMMRSFFNYCQEQEYMIANPMRKIKTPRREHPLPIFLTDDEAKRFIETPTKHKLDWVKKRDRAVLDILFYTGVRKSELLHLDLDDVNLEEWLMKVRRGKGKKDRIIPLAAAVIKSLTEYLKAKPIKHPALFVSLNYTRRLGIGGLYKLFKQHLKNAKITRAGITVHKIRHTFATMILKGSKNLVAVQELLGHTDLSTTKIYLHTTMEDLRKAIEKHPMG